MAVGNARARAVARPALTADLRGPAVALAVVGAVLLVVPAFLFAGDTGPSRLDRAIQQVVDGSSSGLWTLADRLDWLGEPLGRAAVTVAVAAVCLLAGRRRLAIAGLMAMVAATALSTVLKHVVDRQIHDGYLSYPSGHTAAGTVAATILGLLLADLVRAGRIAGTATTLVFSVIGGLVTAWAQITLSAHYPTDTLGGYGCGLLAATVAVLAIPRQT
ncbi:MAG TPA: phosphatase PAP2 family protein [Kribbella sp.]|nr:phosphatase PAP2 family protein [Kribbella sp.]